MAVCCRWRKTLCRCASSLGFIHKWPHYAQGMPIDYINSGTNQLWRYTPPLSAVACPCPERVSFVVAPSQRGRNQINVLCLLYYHHFLSIVLHVVSSCFWSADRGSKLGQNLSLERFKSAGDLNPQFRPANVQWHHQFCSCSLKLQHFLHSYAASHVQHCTAPAFSPHLSLPTNSWS